MSKFFYAYPATQPFVISASSRNTDAININNDFDFYVQYITAYTTTAYKLLLQITVNNISMFNIPLLLETISGNGVQSNYYPIQMKLDKSSRVILDWQNLDTSSISVYLVFVGYQLRGDFKINTAKK